ncbi:MAG: hypothetical protein Ct9H90mP9_2880 [Pseudomonadota bacterium]|nr:MAG: hypothetical protein Ct9H90mP9_2880 [Pseudomonadota bacterium]
MPHPEIEQNVQELIFPVENLPEQEPQNFEGKLGPNPNSALGGKFGGRFRFELDISFR